MRRTAVVSFGLLATMVAGGALLTGCGSDSTPASGSGGRGGATGSGGRAATGGSTGSGGTSATGGAVGSGGGAGGLSSGGVGGGNATGGAAGSAGGSAGAGQAGGGAGGALGGAGGSAAVGGRGGAGGGAGAGVGGSAGQAGAGGAAGSAGGSAGMGGMGGANPIVARGEYLVKNVLGCVGCHTPSGGSLLSGVDCFVNSNGSCLSSPNLTNDATGLRNLTDQQIKDAITLGKSTHQAGKYLFANMPYFQFANLTGADTSAIVAFLRSLPGVAHQVAPNTAPYDVAPSAPQNAAVDPTYLPSGGTSASVSNGKYLATLACVTCHTVDVANATPKIIDGARAFQGGKIVNATVSGAARMVQTANLTPHETGIAGWTAAQVATAITAARDRNGATICGMRSLPNMAPSDASDIGAYLLAIPPAINALTMTCQ